MHCRMKAEYAALIAAVVIALVLLMAGQGGAAPDKVSSFGAYRGYTEKAYDGTKTVSGYLPLPNGTRLAYDLILPVRNGAVAAEPLPVLFKYTPYLRTFTIFDQEGNNIVADLVKLGWKERAMLRLRYWLSREGRTMGPLFRTPWLRNMVEHGYAVIVVERPGTGASFGQWDASHEPGGREAGEVMDWIAAQPWCNGRIGMYGDSFQAMIQFAAAAAGNPHLKAIFPTSAPLEMYNAISYPGGVFNTAFDAFFRWSTAFLQAGTVTPVDGDKDGALLAQARRERSRTLPETTNYTRNAPYRDSVGPLGISIWQERASLYPLLDKINRAGVPVYMTNGWYDIFTADMFVWYNNLAVPKRLVVRPHDHSEVEKDGNDLKIGTEALRWFDYWLKGIDNGIMDEPSLHYYVMGAPRKEAWRTADRWPLPEGRATRFSFAAGKSGTVSSTNDGVLTTDAPALAAAADVYTVDYTTTSGAGSRWSAVNWPRNYPDMRANDARALTYTSPPLEADLEVTGHPVAHLWLAADVPDLDAFVYLEKVDARGRSAYITEGNLRASHRTQGRAPFDTFGLPFHTHFRKDLAPIPAGEPVELVFPLLPTSYVFPKGSRIRITVAFADADNFETPVLAPAPTVRVLREADHPSGVVLPLVPAR